MLAWILLSKAPAGSLEATLSKLLQNEGIGPVADELGVERDEIRRWAAALLVPPEHAELVRELADESERRSKAGRWAMYRLQAFMGPHGYGTQAATAMRLGVSRQAVNKALRRDRTRQEPHVHNPTADLICDEPIASNDPRIRIWVEAGFKVICNAGVKWPESITDEELAAFEAMPWAEGEPVTFPPPKPEPEPPPPAPETTKGKRSKARA